MNKLSHLDSQGSAHMVDVSDKPSTNREATAEATVRLSGEAFALAKSGNAPKGDILATARIAGIMAAKRTWELIPLCHPLAITSAKIDFDWLDDDNSIRIAAVVRSNGATGVEMEALTAASIAALTVYDMVKAVDRAAAVESVRLVAKSGGKSGTFLATQPPSKAAAAKSATGRTRPKAVAREVAAPKPGPHAQREAFREFMTGHRLRPTQWAKDAGVPAAQILAYLTGQSRALAPETAKRLAKAAKVRVEDMFR